ncbi:hypothetical protein QP232_07720 [Alloscardovia omnicolens]|uniref:hypothetical protein n=1 Tax=Alloscardovia omnicolens TaxID=419015 RepID=UPI00254DA464|nr:hypothetical protein [Alloscardovia omnicolens]MDK6664348.1 hypothetical protein [Alloscardovia omnicolens]MDK7748706.1 hypothetical protein [Alloscardovia omnicolens]
MTELNGVSYAPVADDVATGNDRDWLFDRFGEPHAVAVTLDLASFASVVDAGDTSSEGTIPSGLFLEVADNGVATLAGASSTKINAVLADPIKVKFTKTGLSGKLVVSAIWNAVIRRDRIKNNNAGQKFATTSLYNYTGSGVPTSLPAAPQV